jgi:hypothetical protein
MERADINLKWARRPENILSVTLANCAAKTGQVNGEMCVVVCQGGTMQHYSTMNAQSWHWNNICYIYDHQALIIQTIFVISSSTFSQYLPGASALSFVWLYNIISIKLL